MRRVLVVLALLGLVLAGSAVARTIQGTDRNNRLVGTPRADAIFGHGGSDQILGLAGGDLLSGGAGRDVIDGGPGNDRIVAQYDGGRDRVLCGGGLDVVDADQLDDVASDCELVSRRLSRDPYTDATGQHETEVEPDSLTVGRTTVVAFQVGRRFDGAANNVGFAVSNDDGRTWRNGLLPGLTGASIPAGTNVRATDPAVAYDARTGSWLIGTLALGPVTRLTVSRSSDGLTWSSPVTAIEDTTSADVAFDKNWLICDNGAVSRFRGRCYLMYTDTLRGDSLASLTSSDGGVTWSAPVRIPVNDTVGVFPVIRPDGGIVAVFLWQGSRSRIGATVSADGGASFGAPTVVADVQTRTMPGLRLFPLPSADIDPSGRVWATWHDCRFSAGCSQNGVVVSTSSDGGRTWTSPSAVTSGENAMLPAIGIHPVSSRAAFVYYVVRARGIDAELVEVGPDGRRLA